MSLEIIHKFQIKLHNLLNNLEFIKTNIQKIYLSIPQDGKCPYLLINISNVKDISKFTSSLYEIEFEIIIFTKENNHLLLLRTAEHITQLLTPDNCQFDNCKILGIKKQNLVFEQAKDLMSSKLTINYKTCLSNDQVIL